MLKLIINTDEYKIYSDFRRQNKLKAELLSRYRDSDEVVIYADNVEIDRLTLEDLFNN